MSNVLQIRQSELAEPCKRKRVLQYTEGLTRKRTAVVMPPSKADIGTLFHTGMEHHYRDGTPAHEAVHLQGQRIQAEWAAEGMEMPKEWKEAYNLAWLMCKGYEEWLVDTGADAGFTVTGVEREVIVPWGSIHGYDVEIVAHIDLEGVDALGRTLVIDHKSVQSVAPVLGPPDFQRLTYAVLRKLEDGTHVNALVHNQAKRVKRTAAAKPPFYGRFEVSFNEAHLIKHQQVMDVIIEEIVQRRALLDSGQTSVNGPEFYASPNKDCSWRCPYVGVCPGMDDGSDWEWHLSEWFERTGAHVPGEEE